MTFELLEREKRKEEREILMGFFGKGEFEGIGRVRNSIWGFWPLFLNKCFQKSDLGMIRRGNSGRKKGKSKWVFSEGEFDGIGRGWKTPYGAIGLYF